MWRDTETRRDVVSGQPRGNSVSVVEDVYRVDSFSRNNVQVHQWSKTSETAYNVGTPARLRASMPKPSDILAVRIVIHHVWSQKLMFVAARVCMSVTQRRVAVANLSQNSIMSLFGDLRDTHTQTTEFVRTCVCKFGVIASHGGTF